MNYEDENTKKETANIIDQSPKLSDERNAKTSGDIDIILISEMSNRCKNTLLRNGIRTLSELRECYNSGKISSLKNVGKIIQDEIKETLGKDNFTLIQRRIPISYYFPFMSYGAFLDYCVHIGIHYVDELSNISNEEIMLVPECPPRKAKEIISIIEKMEERNLIQRRFRSEEPSVNLSRNEIVQKNKVLMFEEINDQLLNMRVSALYYMGIPKECIRKLNDREFYVLDNLRNVSEERLAAVVGSEFLPKFRDMQNILRCPTHDVVNTFFDNHSDSVEYQVMLARVNGDHYNQLALKYNMTSAQIKDLEIKYLKALDGLLTPLVNSQFSEKGYFAIRDIKDSLNDNRYADIIAYWLDKSGKYNNLKFAQIFVPIKLHPQDVINNLYDIAEEYVGDATDISSCSASIEEKLKSLGYGFIDIDSFIKFLISIGYNQYACFVTWKNVSYGYLCSKLIEKYYPNGFMLYDPEELDHLRDYAVQEFGDIGIPSDNKPMSASIAKYVVFCDRGKVISKDSVKINPDLLKRIKRYIDRLPQSEVNCSEPFYFYKELLSQQSNINNPYLLWSVIKWHYKEKYDFSKKEYFIKLKHKEKTPTPLYREEDVRSWVIKPTQEKPNTPIKLRLRTDYQKGCQVYHAFYGTGVVVDNSYDDFAVEFEKYGIKNVDVEFCVKNNIFWKI